MKRLAHGTIVAWLVCWLLIGSIAPIFADPLPSQPAPVTESSPHALKIMTRNGVRPIGPTAVGYDFGNIDLLKQSRYTHTFTLRNASRSLIVLDGFQISCGCTQIRLLPNSENDGHRLAPGQHVDVQVVIDFKETAPGETRKYVWAFVPGDTMPVATMQYQAHVHELVAFTPSRLDFGRTTYGAARSLRMMARVDPRLLNAHPAWHMICTNPYVRVAPERRRSFGAKSGLRTYLVALSPHAPIGALQGEIYFVKQQSVLASQPAPSLPQALTTMAAGLRGDVVGRVAAHPGVVMFGTVAVGQEAARAIILAGIPTSMKKPMLLCSNPAFDVRFTSSPTYNGMAALLRARGNPKTAFLSVLKVRLRPQRIRGALQGQISVLLRDGEALLIPVFADISDTSTLSPNESDDYRPNREDQ